MPFWDAKKQIFHLFYLFDRRGHKSKCGLGAHQWGHIYSKNSTEWFQCPLAIPIDRQEEGSICTGSVIYYKEKYIAFYAVRMSDGSPAQLSFATSDNCIQFKKSEIYLGLDKPYTSESARDPMVFEGKDGKLNMLITTSIRKDEKTTLGCLAHAVFSFDFENGIYDGQIGREPLIIMEDEKEPECPDYFEHNGKYYLIYNINGVAHYYISDVPLEDTIGIPVQSWQAPENNIVIDSKCRVPKTAKFGKNQDRIIAVGFRCHPNQEYAGTVYFSEIKQNPDGTLEFTEPLEFT